MDSTSPDKVRDEEPKQCLGISEQQITDVPPDKAAQLMQLITESKVDLYTLLYDSD